MTSLAVRIAPADPARTASARAALVSLPISYREARGPADVVVLSGAPGWASRIREEIGSGVRGVIVTDPVADPDLAALVASENGVPVVLAETWASNPAVDSAVEAWRDWIEEVSMVDARAVVTGEVPLRDVLLRQVRSVLRLGVRIATLSVAAETGASLLAVGRSDRGARIAFDVARSAAGSGRLDMTLVARDAVVRVRLPDGSTAQPGEGVLTSPSGAAELPQIWESPSRAAWIALREALDGRRPADGLDGFVAAIGLVSRAAARRDGRS